ncbi:MAG: elongation factor G [Elusimicrobia bacterium]|nr:elongation factor G [Elusimicrobiota bacterium]
MNYAKEKIRNVAIVGSGGAGKTSLVEAILFNAKITNRLGKVEEGNTTSDYNPDEISRISSIYTSLMSFENNGVKINILDTPGYSDFIGEAISAISVADSVIFVLDAATDIDATFEYLWENCDKPKVIFINKLDKENVDFAKTVKQLKEFSGLTIPVFLPDGTSSSFSKVISLISDTVPAEFNSYKEKYVEAVSSSDDVLIEKYLEGKEISKDELFSGLKKGIKAKTVIPVLCGSATKNVGCDLIANFITDFLPQGEIISGYDKALALVFKSVIEPQTGSLSFLRIYSGKVVQGQDLKNANRRTTERLGTLCTLLGKKKTEISEAEAGDIIVSVKLKETQTNDILCDESRATVTAATESAISKIKTIIFPEPSISKAVFPKSKGEEEKVASALQSMMREDPTIKSYYNKETKELILSGLGALHIEIAIARVKERYGIDVELKPPRVAYRETIKGTKEVQGKYKRQTGGRGQYGDCWLKVEAMERGKGFEFVNAIREGRIPRNYIPAVEKGVKESMEQGVVAGYPVTDMRVTLYDGSYHEVDSSDMAFKIAGSMALKKGVTEAKPVILEPIAELEVVIPDDYMGAVMGDLNARRGRVMGMDRLGKKQKVIATAPLSEVSSYATDLRSITKGAGSFKMKFSHYEEAPSIVSQPLIELYQKQQQEGR